MEKEDSVNVTRQPRTHPFGPAESVAASSWTAAQEELQHKEQTDGVQSMYCKELVFGDGTEFSFEELRAQRYYKWLNEKAMHLSKVKEDLKLQIEQKQKLIQGQKKTDQQQQLEVPQCSAQEAVVGSAPVPIETAPLMIHSEPENLSNVALKNGLLSQNGDLGHGRSAFQQRSSQAAKPFTVWDENTVPQKSNSCYNLRSSSVNHKSLKLPTSILKARQPSSEYPSDKEASISRSEEAIINGHSNKTLCRSPNDTCDFVRAAQLASTPFGGPVRQNPAERVPVDGHDTLNKTASVIFKEPNTDALPETKKLSPIQEITHEWGHSSLASTYLQEPESRGRATSHSESTEFKQPTSEREPTPVPDTKTSDPCSLEVRKALLDQVDLSSFAELNIKTGPLLETDDDLHFDGETLIFLRKMGDAETYLYCSSGGNVLVKADRSAVAWDFYISSRLRARLPADLQHCHVRSTCYLYENGSLTLWRTPRGQTIQDLMEEHIDRRDVPLLAVQLLEMVKQMHSCRLVHGALRPDTLMLCQSSEDTVLIGIDFSSSLDLELQTEVKIAQAVPSAQDYIRKGLLSPSASPYQVDLCGIAELVHMLLFGENMKIEKQGLYWRLAEQTVSNISDPLDPLWEDFFQKILNPEEKSTETVLSTLINNLNSALYEGLESPFSM